MGRSATQAQINFTIHGWDFKKCKFIKNNAGKKQNQKRRYFGRERLLRWLENKR